MWNNLDTHCSLYARSDQCPSLLLRSDAGFVCAPTTLDPQAQPTGRKCAYWRSLWMLFWKREKMEQPRQRCQRLNCAWVSAALRGSRLYVTSERVYARPYCLVCTQPHLKKQRHVARVWFPLVGGKLQLTLNDAHRTHWGGRCPNAEENMVIGGQAKILTSSLINFVIII